MKINIYYMKILKESEVSSGDASGKAGVASLPFNKGYYSSGNNGSPGIEFTPKGEPSFKTYKSMKHSKKNVKEKREKMKKFREFAKESVNYENLEIRGINFIDDNEGYVKIEMDGKQKMEHFSINHAGYVHFQLFHPEQNYYQLVQYVYEQMPECNLKTKVLDNYEEVFQLETLTEEASATMGNTGGMGAVVSAQPSSTPGDVAGGTKGSGDIGQTLGTYTKPGIKMKKDKKKKRKIESFDNFKIK